MLSTLIHRHTAATAAVCLTAALLLSVCSCKKTNESSSTVATNLTNDSLLVSTPVLVGTMTYQKNGYILIFKNDDPNFDTAMRSIMVEEFFLVYPQLVDRFNPAAPHTVKFTVTTTYDGIAATSGDSTFFSSTYCSENPNDIDVVSHEIMHIVQAYHDVDAGWLVEGIADYARYTYGVYNKQAGWTLQAYNSSQQYTDGYGVTAHFLVWVQEKGYPKIVDVLDASLRNQTYGSNTWVTETSQTVDQLWQEYIQSPSLQEELPSIGSATDVTKGATLTVSQDNKGGASSSEGSLMLIDDNIVTKFFTSDFVSGLYMQQQLTSAQVATSYLLISGNDSPDRDPKSWRLQGSNDGANWTSVDTRSNEVFESRGLEKIYTFTNSTAYNYYRLTVSANNGSTDFQLTEWRMLK